MAEQTQDYFVHPSTHTTTSATITSPSISTSIPVSSSPALTPYEVGSTTPPPLPGRPPTHRMTTTGNTPPKAGSSSDFDVVATYERLLAEDPDLTMPVAAIESLVHALAHTPATTVSETLDLLSTLTAELKRRIPNPISLSAGTDLFQRYIITTLQRPHQLGLSGGVGARGDFEAIRNHLVRNGRLFVERAKEARDKIARFGKHFVRDGSTVLTNGGSRVVGALLKSAAEASVGSYGGRGSIRFRVIYVVSSDEEDAESTANIRALRKLGIPVATIPPTAIAYSLGEVTQCFVGAEGVVENGGIISRLGTYQMGMLAKAAGKPFYVVAESHKFVRLYPLGQMDLGIEQRIVEFKAEGRKDKGRSRETSLNRDEGVVADIEVETAVSTIAAPETIGRREEEDRRVSCSPADAVDFTPPNLISGIITESGILLPSAVSEELIKIWF